MQAMLRVFGVGHDVLTAVVSLHQTLFLTGSLYQNNSVEVCLTFGCELLRLCQLGKFSSLSGIRGNRFPVFSDLGQIEKVDVEPLGWGLEFCFRFTH